MPSDMFGDSPRQTDGMRFGDRGDPRQLYALDRRAETIEYLPEGEADAFRADCDAGHLVCPHPRCAHPAYLAVGGQVRRHHFRHRAKGVPPHDLRTWNHLTGKLILAQHLRARHPDADVQVSEEAHNGDEKPDLLVTLADRSTIAIEIQYGRLTSERWRERHLAYERSASAAFWILGHLPPHFRRPPHEPEDDNLVVLGSLLQNIEADLLPMYFIDPDRQEIATVLTESGRVTTRLARLATDPIESCEIVDGRLLTPSQRREDEIRADREERQRRATTPVSLAPPRPASIPAPLATVPPADPSPASRPVDEGRATAEAAWEDAKPIFLAELGLTEVSGVVTYEATSNDAIELAPAHWHARLIYRVMEGRIGETFTARDAASPFVQGGVEPTPVLEAVSHYLFYLRRAGYVHFENDSWDIPGTITVLADLTHPPSERLAHAAPGGPFVVRLANANGRLVAVSFEGELLADLRPLREGE